MRELVRTPRSLHEFSKDASKDPKILFFARAKINRTKQETKNQSKISLVIAAMRRRVAAMAAVQMKRAICLVLN
jgi:hypothetical protein